MSLLRPVLVTALLAATLATLLAAVAPRAVAAAAPAPSAGCPGADVLPAAGTAHEAGQALLCLLNEERARRRLTPLRAHARLARAAEAHSSRMVRLRAFTHATPGGPTLVARVRRAGYLRAGRPTWLGENIAWGAGARASARSILRGWMASPPHRANVLAPRFREIGIGIAAGAPARLRSASPAATVTADFGRRGPRRR